ncbi:MmcQ/YjbR family DNA-binding protein [Alkalicoccobacillus porphyridii]|uniref:MmcQ/YjbR family DNA-binding protein n=1 Tax=Alkalicoccobacillus porphyridii TaxID=2597270 RepID=A0A553ZW65_9BACI|nr:MmcQ/YjbR family DNA-binding protein [Alkalicoccobacillus porphyridii]TSB45585.1 MmcQ/YjbR family DNA-binding protein [Alkalicoccobacillus porphyridii]
MNNESLHKLCLSLPGATHDHKVDWQSHWYYIGGKLFAIIGEKSGSMIILKCDPYRAEELREQYEGITPGYHMNKTHWNSVYYDSDVEEETVEALIQHSYELVLKKLPKKVQMELKQI